MKKFVLNVLCLLTFYLGVLGVGVYVGTEIKPIDKLFLIRFFSIGCYAGSYQYDTLENVQINCTKKTRALAEILYGM